ncbi:hypothetical protein [Chitinophaga sp. CF418]|uniref:hypothetical protein n=1 Tax=Chitinophaga sp. CF418 TaxID=1855287 RepID=UPI000912764A|nr:hypothetical protein [Chitinophaga sp. CF418]SHN17080.1 hypothetical protein SAMN05216311_106117 [Chitinophaga sp. CF418]
MSVLRTGLMILCGVAVLHTANAQEVNDTAKLFAEMKTLQGVYQQKALSFDIRYTYASELHPGEILDSLSGHADIAGSKYYYQMANTEMTANDKYVITLFKEDKIMYLSKPMAMNAADPLEQMRASLKTAGVNRCSVTEKGTVKSIRVGFKEGGPYKELQMDFDKSSGYLTSMRYVLKTSMLMESTGGANAEAPEEYGEYAIVQSYYDNYKQLSGQEKEFDSMKFFYKEGDEFKPTAAYSEYKVFVGSPDLQ